MSTPLPSALVERLESHLGKPIRATHSAAGGCINRAATLELDDGKRVFLKWNRDALPGLFAKEASGLEALRAPQVLRVPKPLLWKEPEGTCPAFLLLEHIEQRAHHQTLHREEFGRHFGAALAALHRQSQKTFGFAQDNYIGTLPQSNAPSTDWNTFFATERIGPQMERACTSGAIRGALVRKMERFYTQLPSLLPARPARSLLHGDLWSGNYLIDTQGNPVLIDPAVYYGHREAELAFTELFGGFPTSFYTAYQEAWPLDPAYKHRRHIYNTYPLLVHVNLFGGSYTRQLDRTLEKALRAVE